MRGEAQLVASLVHREQEGLAEEIKPAPEFGSSLDVRYLQGLGTVDERMIILVDIEKLMTSRDMELIETAEEMAA